MTVDRKIQMLSDNLLHAYVDYLHAHMSESGLNGNLVYTPFPLHFEHPKEMMIKNIGENIKKTFTTPRWERTFICLENDQIIAHAALKGHYLDAALHRCEVGLGMNKNVQGQRLGTRLMEHAISWLKNESPIEYLDLHVFSHNHTAMKLYQRLGFTQLGLLNDMFRINDQSINDIIMSLKLR